MPRWNHAQNVSPYQHGNLTVEKILASTVKFLNALWNDSWCQGHDCKSRVSVQRCERVFSLNGNTVCVWFL